MLLPELHKRTESRANEIQKYEKLRLGEGTETEAVVPCPDSIELYRCEGHAVLRGPLLASELDIKPACCGEAVEEGLTCRLQVDACTIQQAPAQCVGTMMLGEPAPRIPHLTQQLSASLLRQVQ